MSKRNISYSPQPRFACTLPGGKVISLEGFRLGRKARLHLNGKWINVMLELIRGNKAFFVEVQEPGDFCRAKEFTLEANTDNVIFLPIHDEDIHKYTSIELPAAYNCRCQIHPIKSTIN